MKIVGFDVETTGLEIGKDQIVSADIVSEVESTGQIEVTSWILKTDIESSPEAQEKHGITREIQDSEGEDYETAILEIANELLEADYVVTANGAFDVSMLQASIDKLPEEKRTDMSAVKMIDIQVLDKFIDKYRKGSRRLENIAKHYRVAFEGDFHSSEFDAIVALGVFKKLQPMMWDRGFDIPSLPELCAREFNKQKKDLASYFKRSGKKATVQLGYPVYTEEICIG